MINLGVNPVLNFASAMQKELNNNSHKGISSWRSDCELTYLFKRLKEEVLEIELAIKDSKSEDVILSECADVGNFAMMIADIYQPGMDTA